MSQDSHEFRRNVMRSVLIVVAIAAVFGLVLGGITTVVMSGVLPEPKSAPAPAETSPEDEPEPSPRLKPTESPTDEQTTEAENTPSDKKTKKDKKDKKKPKDKIRFRASTTTANSYERVELHGRYRGAVGKTLQVQRKENGQWTPFPTTANVQEGGTFSTYVELGQPGPNRMRVVDPTTGTTSRVVTITIS